MTFNPNRFEYPYGVHLLDDLHNIFPEVLYDADIFPRNLLVNFLQLRINSLFPQEYMQSRSQYNLFQRSQRRQNLGILQSNTSNEHSRIHISPIPMRQNNQSQRPNQQNQHQNLQQNQHHDIQTSNLYTIPLSSLFTIIPSTT